MNKLVFKAVSDYFIEADLVPAHIRDLATQATFDLYHGPIMDNDTYPGFVKACATITSWCEDNVSDLWIGEDSGCVSDCLPQPSYDEDGAPLDDEAYYYASPANIVEILFGVVGGYLK